MKALVHLGEDIQFKEISEPKISSNQVKIAIKVAGLNHRDLHIPERRGYHSEPLILGSDGAGIVIETGADVKDVAVGDEVIINPGLGWIDQSDAPPDTFEIVGMPNHGTFSETYVVDSQYVEPKPYYLTWEEAGVLALSALTGYRALFTKGGAMREHTIFLPGAGSGVITFAVQFAKAIGARVIVTSRSAKKRKAALALGADLAIDTNSNWQEVLAEESIDLVIESVGRATFNRSLSILKKGGKIVTFGATTEDEISLNIRQFFYGQYQLFGSTMGSREEFRDMLRFMEEYQIHPVVDRIFPFEEAKQAFAYLDEAHQFGKIGLKI